MTADPPGAGHRTPVPVVSLDDKRIVRLIFTKIGSTPPAYEELRRKVFRQIAKSTNLQRLVLDVLSKRPEAQNGILHELAKNPQLKRKFIVVAHEESKTRSNFRR